MAEILTITYDIDPSKIGTQTVRIPDDTWFLYGDGWQEGNFWRRQNHLDRLKVECLIDRNTHPMSIVQSEDDRYNALLHSPLTPDRYKSPLSKLYIGIIERPEHAALSLAQLGNVDRLLSETKVRRGTLTDEEMDFLETWSRLQLIRDRTGYLRKIQPSYRDTHKSSVVKWEGEVEINLAWLNAHEIDPRYNPGEMPYKDILSRVIDNMLDGNLTVVREGLTIV